jgi:hypothetical protein
MIHFAYVNGLPIALFQIAYLFSLTTQPHTALYSCKQQPHAQDDLLIPETYFKP